MTAKENRLQRLEDAFDKAVADFMRNTAGSGKYDGFLQTKAIAQMDLVRRLYYHQTKLLVDRVLRIRRFGE